ncbi:MAG: L,D-transpeptidase [Paludibaculum sp.]
MSLAVAAGLGDGQAAQCRQVEIRSACTCRRWSTTRPSTRPARSSSTPTTASSTSCSATARRGVTASASASRASNGPAPTRSPARPNGRTWTPPQEMIAREAAKGHYLPASMEGGPENPLGSRAMYLGSTLYRIHGTNAPWTIGYAVSSGCIRMRNEDVVDLYDRVNVGTKVIVI